jgi:hypothetical protein
MMSQSKRSSGRVAIVEIAATETTSAVLAVEVALNGETLTIADQNHTLSEEVRHLAVALLDQIRKEQSHDSN